MSKKNRDKNEQKPSDSKNRWPIAVVVLVVVAGIVLMVIPKRQEQSMSGSPGAPLFKNEGQVTITRRDGTVAVTIDVEIADTPERREIGLMGRPTMEERQGMLFVFPAEQPLAFWMKNTLLPLDMFFIDAQGEILTIHRHTVPYSEASYPSRGPGLLVLETIAGFADKYGIAEGDRLSWKRTK
jgi:hypothetical protein